MSVFRWIVRILAVLGIGAIWWLALTELNAAADTLDLARGTVKAAIGFVGTYLIARLLTRSDS